MYLIQENAWMEFAELYDKYKLGETTNSVEGAHSIRRKFADKRFKNYHFYKIRLNYSVTYSTRANIAFLSMYLTNWIDLVKNQT